MFKDFEDIMFCGVNIPKVVGYMMDEVSDKTNASFDNDEQREIYQLGVLNTLSALKCLLDQQMTSGDIVFYYPDTEIMEEMCVEEMAKWHINAHCVNDEIISIEKHDTDEDVRHIYNCKKKILYPPKNFITYNFIVDENNKYKDNVQVDECIANEIEELWSKGIKTTGCCCGHGFSLGFIEVTDDCIEQMEELGYVHYIYDNLFGGEERKDAFVPKTYGHNYDGYSEGYLG